MLPFVAPTPRVFQIRGFVTYATQANGRALRRSEADQLTDRAAVATGAIDAAVIARALSDTDAVIDGYLGTRYTLPLSEMPPLVMDLALQIAIYKLHINEPDAKTRTDYEQAAEDAERHRKRRHPHSSRRH